MISTNPKLTLPPIVMAAGVLLLSLPLVAFGAMVQPMEEKIMVVAHRGASALRPEHTLAAYAKAIEDGADFIEPDLVATRDGMLVARHENEISGTTDVARRAEFASRMTRKMIDGVSVEGWFTEDFTLEELKTLRARERLPDWRGTAYDGAYQIATLDEIIDLLAERAAASGRTVGLIPEIKHSTYFSGLGLAMEAKLLEVLHAHDYTKTAPVIIQSFEVENLIRLRQSLGAGHANIHLLQLIGSAQERPGDVIARAGELTYADMLQPEGLRAIAGYAEYLGLPHRFLIPLDAQQRLGTPTSLLRDAHAAGLKVYPYTFRPENAAMASEFRSSDPGAVVNRQGSADEIRAYLDAGMDGFFTDDPAVGRQAVDHR